MDEEEPIKKPQKEILVIEMINKELIRILGIVLLLAFVFLFLRLLLRGIGANPENIFTGFIYLISGIFLLPFFGILPQSEDAFSGDPTFDSEAAIAILCYLILIPVAMIVSNIIAIILKSSKKVKETIAEKKPIDTSVVDEVVE